MSALECQPDVTLESRMLSFVIAEEDVRIETSYPFNDVTAVFLLNNHRYHVTLHARGEKPLPPPILLIQAWCDAHLPSGRTEGGGGGMTGLLLTRSASCWSHSSVVASIWFSWLTLGAAGAVKLSRTMASAHRWGGKGWVGGGGGGQTHYMHCVLTGQ